MHAIWFDTAWLADGWHQRVRIEIENGLIASITPDAEPMPGDERHAIAVPGLCAVHSHAFQRGMAGLTEYRGPGDDDFWTWRALMYQFLDRIDPDDAEAIAARAYADMLETGFTRVGEFHYLHHAPDGTAYANPAEMTARIVAAGRTSGIGMTLLPVFYAHGGFGGAAPTPGQRRFLNDLDGFARLVEGARRFADDDTNVGVAPHSLRAVTPDELAAMPVLAAGGPIHIHAAEQVREVEDCVAWSGARPVQWLLANAPVDRRWCMIHATHLTDAETDALAASGAVAGLCPITEANLGDGIFPAVRYLAAGGAFGIGTDSNVLIDPAQELRQLEYSQRLVHRGRNMLAGATRQSVGATLFAGAERGGAQALNVPAGIVAGGSADIVSLDADHDALIGRSGDALIDGWVFAARTGAVDCVWRRGRKVVADGRHVASAAIAAAYRRTVEKLLA